MKKNSQANNTYSHFLSEYALYSKFEVNKPILPVDLHCCTFKFFCKNEKDFQTFELSATSQEVFEELGRFQMPVPHDSIPKEPQMNFTEHYEGLCKSCNNYTISITIAGFTDKDSNNIKKYYLRKIGQFPAPEIKPNKEINDFLSEEDKGLYKNALMTLQHGYGIGAYAYFRRIIENEIDRIVQKISELESANKEKISEAIKRHKDLHQKSNLIKAITPYLPASLIEDGDNILLVLYSQLSGGIHSFSDETCLNKASSINTLLIYLIKKINEEKNESGNIKKALKNLK
jgi:hypothetical protein